MDDVLNLAQVKAELSYLNRLDRKARGQCGEPEAPEGSP